MQRGGKGSKNGKVDWGEIMVAKDKFCPLPYQFPEKFHWTTFGILYINKVFFFSIKGPSIVKFQHERISKEQMIHGKST